MDARNFLNGLTRGLVLSWLVSATAYAEDPRFDRGAVLVFNEENDLFVKTDRHYTQGIKFAYLHEDGHMPLGMGWIDSHLGTWGFKELSGRSGYSVGQNMYTPADLTTANAQPNDRPYAGWLYLGWLLHRGGITERRHIPVQESWELELGTIGSPSLAHQAQIWVHQLRGFELPNGWANQLRDEPGFRLKWERSYRMNLLPEDRMISADLIPWGGLSLGTIEDTARLGGMVRVGHNLPQDFGIRIIDSLSTTDGGWSKSKPQKWGAFAFAGSEGRVVGRNAFLDGNLYRDSLNVNKRYIVGDFVVGFNVLIHHLEIGYTHVFRTPEFEAQTQHNEFGSVYAKIRF